ncbi:MAG: 4-hydroxy-tetrahydrodipicolinate reductase [Deltaproteobacteria bacterium]|nr:4-hydroxy-tetrahydrodipicolinate reductase [Deltaproteobacteria bacterium]
MIKILIKGASGKMGRRILFCASQDKEFKVVEAIDQADVLIDFSHPDATILHLELAAKAKKRAVIGTTGHTEEQKKQIESFAKKLPFVLSPNMSVGVNVMWKIIGEAARKLGSEFKVNVTEIHHIYKKDKPSGTALQIARVLAETMKISPEKIPIEAIRQGEVVGIHKTVFESSGEFLEILHNAKSRDTFALGALRAARWIVGKPNGLYSMANVLSL